MQTRSSDENSVSLSTARLSVCPSVKHVHCDKMEEKSVQIFIPYERSFSLVFWEAKWLVGAIPSTWNYGSTGPRWSEIADFEPILARSASAVTPSEKSLINTNRKSTTRFPISLRWSLYVAPKSHKGGQKRKTAVFPLKSYFTWRKSATKFLCVKTVSGNLWGIHWPNYPCKNNCWRTSPSLGQTDRVGAKSPIFDRNTSYVVPNPQNGGSIMQSVQNLNN